MENIKWDELLQLAKEKGIDAVQLRWILDVFKPESDAVEFGEWIGKQGLFNGLSQDNVRRWHKLVGDYKALSTQELYLKFKTEK